ncbi:uncharacterized protein LOC115215765 [Argonauta hians]
MKSLNLPHTQITVALNRPHWLYVYYGATRHHIFSFEESIADFSLEASFDCSDWLLWVISISGHLYRLSEQTISKTQKSSIKAGPCEKTNDFIFDELLTNSSELNFHQNTEPTTLIRSCDSLIQFLPCCTALCVYSDIIAVSSVASNVCTLNLYQKNGITAISEKPASSSRNVPCWSRPIPISSLDSPSFEEFMNLYLISTNPPSVHSSQTIQVSSVVFSSLFGAEANLLDSAVMLLTLPSGLVYHFPLKIWKSQPYSMDFTLPILCHLNAPVINVCFIHLQKQSNCDITQTEPVFNSQLTEASGEFQLVPCLLLSAKNGKCHLFSSPNNFGSQLQVLETVNLEESPVFGCCVGVKPYQLVYTTDTKVIQLNLVLTESIELNNKHASPLSGVSHVALLRTKDDNKLLCMSAGGQLSHICLSDEGFDAKTKVSQEEKSISQLLSQVEQINGKIKSSSEILEAQSHVISQLVMGSHVSWNQSVSDNLQCQLGVIKLSNGETSLQCVLTNKRLSFSSDWSILVQTTTSRKSQHDNHTSTYHTSFKTLSLVNGLKPEESASVDIMLNIKTPLDTRIQISAWLVFHLQSYDLDCHNDISDNLKILLSQGLAIPIYKSNTDFLSFILPTENSATKIHSISNINPPSLATNVKKLACDKPIFASFSDLHKDHFTEAQPALSFKINIPAILQNVSHQHICSDSSHQSCLLKSLLSKMEVISSDEIRSETLMSLRSADCGPLAVSVRQQGVTKYNLDVQSARQGVLVEAVQAILYRLQKMLPDKPAVMLDCSQFLHEIQMIMEEVKSLLEAVNRTERVSDQMLPQVLHTYLKFRHLSFIITSHLYS